MLPENSKQKVTNIKLAAVTGALGLLFIVAASMMLNAHPNIRHEILRKIIPSPSLMTITISDGSQLANFSAKLDLINIQERLKQRTKPDEKYFFSILQGNTIISTQEIPPFVTANGSNGRIAVFDKGAYRILNGTKWRETQTNYIGEYPLCQYE